MKKTRVIVALIILTVIICCIGMFIKQNKKHGQTITDKTFVELSAEDIHMLPSVLDENAFTCTGLSYDPVNDSFWVGNYGAASIDDSEKYPSIIELNSKTFEVKRIVGLPFLDVANANIQGVAYDRDTDSIWFTDSSQIYNINKTGELLSEFSVDPYTDSVPNGIACGEDSSLWVLFYKNYLIHYTKDGEVIDVVKCNYKDQDQITCNNNGEIWISAGADYSGDKNYVIQLDPSTGKIVAGYKVMESYAIEGIAFIDGKLMVINDGLYHDAKIKNNFICVYELD